MVRAHTTIAHDEFVTQVIVDNDEADDVENPTQWMIFRKADGQQIANGWGTTPSEARSNAAARLAELRSDKV